MKKDIGLLALQLTPVVLTLLGFTSIIFSYLMDSPDFMTPGIIMIAIGFLFIFFFRRSEKSDLKPEVTEKQQISAFEGIFQIETGKDTPTAKEINTTTIDKKDAVKIVELKNPKTSLMSTRDFEKTLDDLFSKCINKDNPLDYFKQQIEDKGFTHKTTEKGMYLNVYFSNGKNKGSRSYAIILFPKDKEKITVSN